jgi:DNA helicase II / ATP-dependent DNA helicase PcrA
VKSEEIDLQLNSLNENQLKAVRHQGTPLFVVAGAGTGKTKTLTTRIAYLIEKNNVNPNKILGVTFTNKAAKELRDRVDSIIYPNKMGTWLYTFHAFCLKVLREHAKDLKLGYNNDFIVIDQDDSLTITREVIRLLDLDIKEYPVRLCRSVISGHKTELEFTYDEKMLDIFDLYQEKLIADNLMDFDDLIVYVYKLFKNNEDIRLKYQNMFEHILVDEFQDTDKLQYQILRQLNNKNMFVVGDPDQSIYSFRGAKYEHNEMYVKDFGAKTIVLDENYRSTNNILELANKVIKHNLSRTGNKNLSSNLGSGKNVKTYTFDNEKEEAFFVANQIKDLTYEGISYNEIAVLYRNNVLSRNFEHNFNYENIPYIIYGGQSFYDRKEVKDMLAYLKVVVEESNFYLKRIINVPKRKIGDTTKNKLESFAFENNLTMLNAISSINTISAQTKKTLTEFKNIIINIRRELNDLENIEEIVDVIYRYSNYQEELDQEIEEKQKERKDNINELKSVFFMGKTKYEGTNLEKIRAILDELSLFTDQEVLKNDDNSVRLSTIHQVKGLEFKVVFIVGLEETIFPNHRSFDDLSKLEEERRLFYVAVTRAKIDLYLTNTKMRVMYGTYNYNRPSRFLKEAFLEKETRKVLEKPNEVKKIYKEKNEIEDFNTGDIVTHDLYGKGIVVAISGDILTIAFSVEHGIKKILKTHISIKKG